MATFHPTLPRGARVQTDARGTLEEILVGPAHENDGRLNLFGGAAHLDGHLRLRDGQGVPEGRGHGGPVAADRGQEPSEVPGRRDGSLTRSSVTDHRRRRHRPRRRLRRPVRPAHRPPGARGARLQRDRAPHDHRGRGGRARDPAGIIFSGGPDVGPRRGCAPASTRRSTSSASPSSASATAPSCIAQQLGGEVASTGRGEYGRTDLDRAPADGRAVRREPARRAAGVDEPLRLDRRRRPTGSRSPRRTADAPVAAMRGPRARGIYGVQFHPEVVHTPHGQDVLEHFLYDGCGLPRRRGR